MKFNLTRLMTASLLSIGCSLLSFGQSTNATLSGIVYDPSGAAVPGATVVAVEAGTGQSHQTTSSDGGNYTITNLAIGSYKVTATASGFKELVIPSVVLHVNEVAQFNLTLQVGAVTDQVVVTTELPLLSTGSSSVGQVIENQSIESQPLNGRQFWQLVALVPGSSYTPTATTNSGGSTLRAGSVNVQINGTGVVFNGWLLDGADITEYEQGGTNIQPNVDALSEFKVFTANMPAEYGHTPDAVSVTMKSGTNAVHGTTYEFIRNDITDAHNYFATTSKNSLRRNQFGGTIGAPIKKNKVFVFADIEAARQSEGQVFSDIVPTDAMRTGDFSAAPDTIINPATGDPFPGNVIPSGSISQQALFFLKYLPTPSQAVFTTAQPNDIIKSDLRTDAALTSVDQLMGRYSIADNQEQDPNQFPALGFQQLHSRAQNIALSETHLLSSRWLNEARVGYYRDFFLFGGIDEGTNFDQEAGITGYEQTQLSPSFPWITMSGYSSFLGSFSGNFPKQNRIQTWQYADAMTYTQGKHNIKFGFQLWDQHHTFVHGQGESGEFGFTGEYTGNAFADYLLGLPALAYRSYPLTVFGIDGREWAAFGQDTYRITKDLTIDVGLRWEYNPFFNGIDGVTTSFDPVSGKIIVPEENGQLLRPNDQAVTAVLLPVYSDRLIAASALGLPLEIRRSALEGQWAPRVGFAWQPNASDRFVVRSAFGLFPIFQDSNVMQFAAEAPPFLIAQTINNTAVPDFDWGNPFNGQSLVAPNPNPGSDCPGTNLVLLSCVASSFSTASENMKHTYMEEYNLAVQAQLRKNFALTIGYVGNHTVDAQLYSVPTNVPNPGPGSVQSRRPYPQWGEITEDFNFGKAHYNALQASLEKRTGNGYYALISYSYSKCTDNGTSEGAPITLALLPDNNGLCTYDMTQNLTASSVYDLPFGKGRMFLSNPSRPVNAILGDWALAGIFTYHTGQPFTPTIGSDVANTGVSGEWPNRIASGKLAHPTPHEWFNPAAFTIPAEFTYGDAGRDILRSDGLVELDTTLKKNINFTESKDMEIRFEAFNLANHPTFSAPNVTIGTSSAGEVTSTLNANRIFQGGIKFAF
jgi:Carboxypeptidase regulatory-like domain/TonB dependent receptor